MRMGRAAVMAPRHLWGTPALQVKQKRGGTGGSSNSGPAGRKLRPAAKLYRALADMAASYGVVNGVKKRGIVKRAS